jgi:hypothetical protein
MIRMTFKCVGLWALLSAAACGGQTDVVSESSSQAASQVDPCAIVKCAPGEACTVVDGRAHCGPDQPGTTPPVTPPKDQPATPPKEQAAATPPKEQPATPPKDQPATPAAEDPCATARCGRGDSCVVVDGRATCSPGATTPVDPCAIVKCAPGASCTVVDGRAKCVSR